MDMLIWWTSQRDCELIGGGLATQSPGAPKYLQHQYSDRLGRNGRGRLWVDHQFGKVAIDPWPETTGSAYLAEKCAGIVIHEADADFVHRLPGRVTDFQLRRLNNPKG